MTRVTLDEGQPTDQERADQDRADQDRAGQDRAGQDRADRVPAGQNQAERTAAGTEPGPAHGSGLVPAAGAAPATGTVGEAGGARAQDVAVDGPEGPDEARETVEDAPATRRSWLLRTAVVVTVLAAVFLAASGVVWWRADHDQSRHLAQTRDVVLVDARRDVEVLNTLDYRKVPAGLAQWKAVSTGTLATQLGGIDASTSQALVDAGKVSTGTVVDIALTGLDPDKGTASAIASVNLTVKDQSGQSDTRTDRFTVGLTRVGTDWRVSSLTQLPVDLS